MKPLENYRKILTKLCMCSDESPRAKENRIVLTCIIFVLWWSYTISSTIIIWESVDLEDKLFVVFQLCGCTMVIYSLIVMILFRRKNEATFDDLTEFYDENKDDDSFRFLARANNTSEWFWKIYIKYGIICVVNLATIFIYIGPMTLSIYFEGNLNTTEHYSRSFKLYLPWDQQTLIGYIAEMLYSLTITGTYQIVHGVIMLFFISLCLHHRAFYEVFRQSVRKWKIADKKIDHKKCIRKLHYLHVSTKEFFMQTTKVYNVIVAIELITNMLALAVTVFHIDLKLKSDDIDISILLISMLSCNISLFVYCFMGKLATDSIQGMSDCLYESDWHELPIGLQKSFVLLIKNTQKPIYYQGFGVIRLDLETYCDFLRRVSTYYMIFKTLTSD